MTTPFRLRPWRASENDVEAGCKQLLAFHGYWVIRLHAGVYETLDGQRKVRGVDKGTPDYACLHGTHRNFLLEVKRPGGRLSDDQRRQIDHLRSQYELPIVVVESHEELSEFLKLHERSP